MKEYNGFEIIRDYNLSSPFEMFPEIRATKFIRDYTEFYDYNTGERVIRRKVGLGDMTVYKTHVVTHVITLKAPYSESERIIKQVIDKYNSFGDLSEEFRQWCKSIVYDLVITYNDEII